MLLNSRVDGWAQERQKGLLGTCVRRIIGWVVQIIEDGIDWNQWYYCLNKHQSIIYEADVTNPSIFDCKYSKQKQVNTMHILRLSKLVINNIDEYSSSNLRFLETSKQQKRNKYFFKERPKRMTGRLDSENNRRWLYSKENKQQQLLGVPNLTNQHLFFQVLKASFIDFNKSYQTLLFVASRTFIYFFVPFLLNFFLKFNTFLLIQIKRFEQQIKQQELMKSQKSC